MSRDKDVLSVQEDQRNADDRRERGEFVRGVSGFRSFLGDADFLPEPGRYHLFVAFNCPWCHRVILARNLLGLQDSITLDVAFPNRTDESDEMGPNLWEFNPDRIASLTGEKLAECTWETGTGEQLRLAKEIYMREGSTEQSLPVLYDKKSGRIVNNESADIVRMLAQNSQALACTQSFGLYPDDPALQEEIEDLNALIYIAINNGAYKAGFSRDQSIYRSAFEAYFDAFNQLEARLSSDSRPYLMGDQFTEADLRLFPTLYRHDPVYYLRMKLNAARVLDYPHLWRWLCRVYALPGVSESNSLAHCRQGYFGRTWNTTIPLGPLRPMPYPKAFRHPELAGVG